MDNLPRELFDIILTHLSSQKQIISRFGRETYIKIAPYASISRYWQQAIEQKTMQRLNLNHDDIPKFSTVFSLDRYPHRRQYLRHILFITNFPTITHKLEDFEANNLLFSRALLEFFTELSSWECQAGAQHTEEEGLRLSLLWLGDDWTPNHRFLDAQPDLPNVQVITALKVSSSTGMTPHPGALCNIISHLPSLKDLHLELWSPPFNSPELSIDHHHSLAAGIQSFPDHNPQLSILKLLRKHAGTTPNDSFQYPDYTKNGIDPFSKAITLLAASGTLTDLDLNLIPLSKDLFFSPLSPLSTTTWPSLQKLSIRAPRVGADSRWYFTGNPNGPPQITELHKDESWSDYETESESSDSDFDKEYIRKYWRTMPDPSSYNPFIEAMTLHLTKNMPSLQQFSLYTTNNTPCGSVIVFEAANGGFPLRYDPEEHPAKPPSHPFRRFIAHIAGDKCPAWKSADRWTVPESVLNTAKEWAGSGGVVKASMIYRCRMGMREQVY